MNGHFYIYHPETKALLEAYFAQRDPVNPDQWIAPTYSTPKEPIAEVPEGQYNYWNDEDWELREDTTGTWYTPEREERLIESLLEEVDPTWTREIPALTLDELMEIKQKEIRIAYEGACLEPVNELSLDWNGGFDSAIKLDAAMRLAQAAGAPGVRFFDAENHGHDLSFANALTIVLAVAGAFQANLAKKQGLMLDIENANEETLGSIAW